MTGVELLMCIVLYTSAGETIEYRDARAGVRRHITICAPRDAGVSFQHRAAAGIVDDFSMRITGLANSISLQVVPIVKKMLQVVPDHLEQRRLRNDKEGRLLLTEEEWLARLKLRNNTDESNGPSSRKGSKKPWKSHGRTRGKDGDLPSSRKGGKKPWKSHGRTRGKDGDPRKESTNGQADPVLELWEESGKDGDPRKELTNGQADPVLELWEERTHEQELLEQGEG